MIIHTRFGCSSTHVRQTGPLLYNAHAQLRLTNLPKKLRNLFLCVGRNSALERLPSLLRLSPGLPASLAHHHRKEEQGSSDRQRRES